MITNRTFNIGFKRKPSILLQEWKYDETQFEIEDGPFIDMASDLLSLWNTFCDENMFGVAQPVYIEEVFGEI